MSDSTTKLPVKTEKAMPASASIWRPFEDLRQVTLPKTAEARKPAKTTDVKAA